MNKKIGPAGQKWLKSIHIFFGCTWAASGLSLTLMGLFVDPSSGTELYMFDFLRMFIDDILVVPAATGCLLTAMIYSIFTKWGWFIHRWVTVKWCINIFGVLFGTFLLGPWLNSLPPLSLKEGISALSNSSYVYAKNMNLAGGIFQNLTVIFAIFISVLKPWKKKIPNKLENLDSTFIS